MGRLLDVSTGFCQLVVIYCKALPMASPIEMQNWRGFWGGFRLHLCSYLCWNEITAYSNLRLRLWRAACGYWVDISMGGHCLWHFWRLNLNNFWMLHIVRLVAFVRLRPRLHGNFYLRKIGCSIHTAPPNTTDSQLLEVATKSLL